MIRVQSCINPHLDAEQGIAVINPQKQFFEQMECTGTARPGYALRINPIITSRKAFEAYLRDAKNNGCDFLYFFCHARAAVTVSDLFFPQGKPPLDQATIGLDAVADGAEISIKEMCELRETPRCGHPLVFMNACSSAQGDIAFQSQFLQHFCNTWQACGFIGTDWELPTMFADGFARLVLERFFSKERPSIADAFWQTSWEVIKHAGNPFPLIYALYVRPDLTA